MKTKIRVAREKSGLTQSQVAKQAEVIPRQFIRYEQGERKPRVDVALRIAKALNSTVEMLFSEETPPK